MLRLPLVVVEKEFERGGYTMQWIVHVGLELTRVLGLRHFNRSHCGDLPNVGGNVAAVVETTCRNNQYPKYSGTMRFQLKYRTFVHSLSVFSGIWNFLATVESLTPGIFKCCNTLDCRSARTRKKKRGGM